MIERYEHNYEFYIPLFHHECATIFKEDIGMVDSFGISAQILVLRMQAVIGLNHWMGVWMTHT